MRKFLPFGALLLIAACGAALNGPTETAVRLTFDIQDDAVQTELAKKSVSVIERRLARYGAALEDFSTQRDATGATLRMTLPDQELADELLSELAMPYTFAIVREEPSGGTGAITFEGQGTYVPTGITEADLAGAEWAVDGAGAAVRVVFTEAGKAKLRALAATTQDKALGIVARGVLMSKTQGGSALQDEIVIRGIPTPEFAEVFADDVNVGLHVTFTPLP